jgi:hypothetical protein
MRFIQREAFLPDSLFTEEMSVLGSAAAESPGCSLTPS